MGKVSERLRVKTAQKEVLLLIADTLLVIQSAEKMIKFCMKWVLPKAGLSPEETFDQWHAQNEKERKKTLGYFLGALRSRATVDKTFDSKLERFYEDRNDFVHDMTAVPGFGFETVEELRFAKADLMKLANDAFHIGNVFMGLGRQWQSDKDLPDIGLPDHEFFKEIDREYKPMAVRLLAKKPR